MSHPAHSAAPAHSVILYDGECGLCSRLVQAVLVRDPAGVFHYCALQSPWAQDQLRRHGLSTTDFDTMVLIEGDRLHLRSEAALRVSRRLPWWRWTGALLVLPRGLRDLAYAWVARRRKRWFPISDACMILRPEWHSRFIDGG
jgi:predicted DCC family thiol-disulfide oxidoreductase YuxK